MRQGSPVKNLNQPQNALILYAAWLVDDTTPDRKFLKKTIVKITWFFSVSMWTCADTKLLFFYFLVTLPEFKPSLSINGILVLLYDRQGV